MTAWHVYITCVDGQKSTMDYFKTLKEAKKAVAKRKAEDEHNDRLGEYKYTVVKEYDTGLLTYAVGEEKEL